MFPEDMVTEALPERFLAAEMIRKSFLLTREEIPYATAVIMEEFKEREKKNLVVIRATIQVERDFQKGVPDRGEGPCLRRSGRLAREEMEAILGVRVFLELWVKLEKNWRDDPRALHRLGFQ